MSFYDKINIHKSKLGDKSMTDLEKAIEKLKNAILQLPEKKQKILAVWLNKWANIIKQEKTFEPHFLPYYKRGDIVYVDFGFNVGNELGGIHYAVVIEDNNNKNNGNVIVVPLTSLTKGKNIDDLPSTDVYLGENIIEWTGTGTIVKPNQIRTISKIRIVKPVRRDDRVISLTGEQLQLIDDKLDQIIKKNLTNTAE